MTNIHQKSVNKAISELTPDDVALALESIPLAQRKQAWANIKQANRLDILVEMRGESRQLLLKGLDDTEIEALFTDVDAEDLLEITDSFTRSSRRYCPKTNGTTNNVNITSKVLFTTTMLLAAGSTMNF